MWPFKRRVAGPGRIFPHFTVDTPTPIGTAVPPASPRRPRGVSHEAMAHAAPPAQDVNPFLAGKPPPGALPSGQSGMAMDNVLSAWAGQGLVSYGGWGGIEAFRGYPYLAELAQRPEYRRGVEIIAKEKTRKWIKLRSSATDGSKDDYLAKLSQALDKFRVQDTFRRADEHDGFFGRGAIYLDTGDSDNPNELRTPLILKPQKIKRGGLKGIRAIEPIWSYPGSYNSSDPLHPNFYKPETWFVQGKEIHRTRLLGLVAREVPDLLKPAYLFGGVSLTQMAEPYVNNWLRARQSVSDLMNAFSVMALSTDMSSTLSGDSGTDLGNRVRMFNLYRDNRGTFVLNKDTEELSNIAAPLGGLDQLQGQAQEHMASVYGIPIIVFFGITPSGLNASSEGELQTWEQWVGAQQEHTFAQPLRVVIRAVQLSEFGEIDETITATFEPLRTSSPLENANIRKANADTAAIYVADGVISPAEERARLATEEEGLYAGLDLSVEIDPPAEALDPTLGSGMREPEEEREAA